MEATYRLTPEEYLQAWRVHSLKGPSLQLRAAAVLGWSVMVLLPIGALILIILYPEEAIKGAVYMGMAGVYILWYYCRPLYQAKKAFRRHRHLSQEMVLRITDDEIEFSGLASRHSFSWEGIERFVESKHLFLLYTAESEFQIIPKRVLDPGQLLMFRDLLRRKIPLK
jgi:hypothetical protein